MNFWNIKNDAKTAMRVMSVRCVSVVFNNVDVHNTSYFCTVVHDGTSQSDQYISSNQNLLRSCRWWVVTDRIPRWWIVNTWILTDRLYTWLLIHSFQYTPSHLPIYNWSVFTTWIFSMDSSTIQLSKIDIFLFRSYSYKNYKI